jgi:DNA polymerase
MNRAGITQRGVINQRYRRVVLGDKTVGMDSVDTYWADRALLEWQLELGADEAINETPINRYDLEVAPPKPAPNPQAGTPARPAPIVVQDVDTVALANAAAAGASDLTSLQAAITAFDHCHLKKGARKMVFAAGQPDARVMIIGDSPSREEDVAGLPFAGVQGDLLQKMTSAISLTLDADDPAQAVYMTTAMPWRVPGDGLPTAKDLAMMRPFLERHITLANPDVVILMGNTACQMLLGKGGISRLRGKWAEVLGRPAMPMAHPVTLLKTPIAKRDAWADLLEVQAKLRTLAP